MLRVAQKRSFFILLFALVLAQVGWWALVFTRDAEIIAGLKLQLSPGAQAEVQSEAYHRKLMFLSESGFFALVSLLALVLLYRALRAEERSRVVQRNFIETVSHESKTPLTALKLRLEALKSKLGDSASGASVALALDEVRRLSGVLEKTMELNRSERHALRFEKLRFSEVVDSVVRRLEPWTSAKGAKVYLDLDKEVEVLGDFTSLQNSVQSLLENAVLHNPGAERWVKITLAQRSSSVLLAVEDNGPGISKLESERVFERFYRGQAGKKVSGTGLGLYLAKVIVEAHRGVLSLSDASQGARFEITIPRAV
jgi:signal transduction histidine kinase